MARGPHPFVTPVTIQGPYRRPRQLLADQSLNGRASIHDETAAAGLGLAGAPIEGPTHFSQFDPLASGAWGPAWFERGCISSHFQTMVVEGDEVQASLTTAGPGDADIEAHKLDGSPVLSGTASIGDTGRPTALAGRLDAHRPPATLWIIDQVAVGATSPEPVTSVITFDEPNGPRYPFSLHDKLDAITEPSPWYRTPDNRWGRPIIPFEMISVLAHKDGPGFPVRQPSVGLFLDLEVRLHQGPLYVDELYDITHTVVAMSESRRTESFWTRSAITAVGGGPVLATVLLHQGVFKDSYPEYPQVDR
jgi:hypothetical protein